MVNIESDENLYREYLLTQSEKAFKTLYLRHSSPLIRYVYRLIKNQQGADEILHDIFAELLSGKFSLQDQAGLKNWFYVVAKNKALNWLQRKKREVLDEAPVAAAVHPQNLEQDFIQNNLIAQLAVLEKKLPDEIVKTWHLRKQGLDNQQIAETLSIPVGTVKSRFFRLVEIFKKEMSL